MHQTMWNDKTYLLSTHSLSLLYIFTQQKAPLSCDLANLPKKGSLELALDALIITVFLVTVDRDAYKPGVAAKLFGVVRTQQLARNVEVLPWIM